jgi:hypothetical protein
LLIPRNSALPEPAAAECCENATIRQEVFGTQRAVTHDNDTSVETMHIFLQIIVLQTIAVHR